MAAKNEKGEAPGIRVRYSERAGILAKSAADELAAGMGAMLARQVYAAPDSALDGNLILIGGEGGAHPSDAPLTGDSFEVARAGTAIAIRAGSERAMLHGAWDLFERLGARIVPGARPLYPKGDLSKLSLKPYRVEPAFKRRAFVSDILTWNYSFADRLAMHLEFDREFIPWMARRGVNAFEYIRHAHDTRSRIDELVGLYARWGIGCEYGGHVLQLLVPRERFETSPEFFPMGTDGNRAPRGNLCVSNPGALRMVCDGALGYVRDYPENEIVHVWGADVRGGAWCSCAQCGAMSPQLQYMKVVNAIASALQSAPRGVPVTYLAYHDTIDPDPALKPLPNVWFEWAPRERCYVHAIDDGSCAVNPRYFESLKRYLEIFQGRGHVFEYYADAILFAGLGFASPAVIARDLRAYRALGIESISCLTFGAYSVLAYPANIEAFVRGTRSPDFEPASALGDTALGRHPDSADAMGKAYRAIETVSAQMLDYADVICPYKIAPRNAGAKKTQIAKALTQAKKAIGAAENAREKHRDALAGAEEALWNYGLEVMSAIGDYLRAREERGIVRRTLGESAIGNIASAIEHIRSIDPAFKGTWGAYDIEWMQQLWLDGLRRNLAEDAQPEEIA